MFGSSFRASTYQIVLFLLVVGPMDPVYFGRMPWNTSWAAQLQNQEPVGHDGVYLMHANSIWVPFFNSDADFLRISNIKPQDKFSGLAHSVFDNSNSKKSLILGLPFGGEINGREVINKWITEKNLSVDFFKCENFRISYADYRIVHCPLVSDILSVPSRLFDLALEDRLKPIVSTIHGFSGERLTDGYGYIKLFDGVSNGLFKDFSFEVDGDKNYLLKLTHGDKVKYTWLYPGENILRLPKQEATKAYFEFQTVNQCDGAPLKNQSIRLKKIRLSSDEPSERTGVIFDTYHDALANNPSEQSIKLLDNGNWQGVQLTELSKKADGDIRFSSNLGAVKKVGKQNKEYRLAKMSTLTIDFLDLPEGFYSLDFSTAANIDDTPFLYSDLDMEQKKLFSNGCRNKHQIFTTKSASITHGEISLGALNEEILIRDLELNMLSDRVTSFPTELLGKSAFSEMLRNNNLVEVSGVHATPSHSFGFNDTKMHLRHSLFVDTLNEKQNFYVLKGTGDSGGFPFMLDFFGGGLASKIMLPASDFIFYFPIERQDETSTNGIDLRINALEKQLENSPAPDRRMAISSISLANAKPSNCIQVETLSGKQNAYRCPTGSQSELIPTKTDLDFRSHILRDVAFYDGLSNPLPDGRSIIGCSAVIGIYNEAHLGKNLALTISATSENQRVRVEYGDTTVEKVLALGYSTISLGSVYRGKVIRIKSLANSCSEARENHIFLSSMAFKTL